MANPVKHESLLADRNGKPMLTTQLATVADAAALTAVNLAITFTANGPTAADAQTVADGAVPTVAETGQFMANVEDFQAQVVADLTAHLAKINAILVVLEDQGLVADA